MLNDNIETKLDNTLLVLYACRMALALVLPIALLYSLDMLTLLTLTTTIVIPVGGSAAFLYFMFKDSFINDNEKNVKEPIPMTESQLASYQKLLSSLGSTPKVIPKVESEASIEHPLRLFKSPSEENEMNKGLEPCNHSL